MVSMPHKPTPQEEEEEYHENNRDIPLPASASVYLHTEYWNERFLKEDHYEWFKDYSQFRHLVNLNVKSTDKIKQVLELGCGSSQMCEGLYKDGFTQITCIDISPVAVEKMQKHITAKGLHGVEVMVMDMLNLQFESESFDIVIEKGTMDVLLVDSGDPWNPKPEAVNKVNVMLQGVHRVLKPEGVFISISFGQPHFRRPLFEISDFTWSMEWNSFGDGFHYFLYSLKKGTRKPDSHKDKIKDIYNHNETSLYQEHLDSENYLFKTQIDDDEELKF